MRSRAISRKKRVFFESPAQYYAKSARAIGNELKGSCWTINCQQKRFERIKESYSHNRKSSSYLLIDLKRLKIVRSTIRSISQTKASDAQRTQSNGKYKPADKLNTFLLHIYSSYIGSLLFGLTEVIIKLLPLTVLILNKV